MTMSGAGGQGPSVRSGGKHRPLKAALAAVALLSGLFAVLPASANHAEVTLPGSNFEIDTDASADQRATLIRLTERYCVVLQTLRQPPPIVVGSRQ